LGGIRLLIDSKGSVILQAFCFSREVTSVGRDVSLYIGPEVPRLLVLFESMPVSLLIRSFSSFVDFREAFRP
jgi:hypothetical protein